VGSDATVLLLLVEDKEADSARAVTLNTTNSPV